MKYTRVEIKSKFKKYKAIICFTVLIPLGALILGKVLISYSEKEATSIAIKLDDFKSIYFLQLGVYEKEESAKTKIKNLKDNGINSILLKDEKYYKVISDVASSPKKLEERKRELDSKEIASYIKDFPIKGVEDSENGNIKEYTTHVKEYILSALDEKESIMKSSYNYIEKSGSLDSKYVEKQSKLNNLIKNNLKNYSLKAKEEYIKGIVEIIVNYNNL